MTSSGQNLFSCEILTLMIDEKRKEEKKKETKSKSCNILTTKLPEGYRKDGGRGYSDLATLTLIKEPKVGR